MKVLNGGGSSKASSVGGKSTGSNLTGWMSNGSGWVSDKLSSWAPNSVASSLRGK